MAVKAIPDGYHSVTPYMIISGATEAIDFYQQAFGATELFRMPAPGGKIGIEKFVTGVERLWVRKLRQVVDFFRPELSGWIREHAFTVRR